MPLVISYDIRSEKVNIKFCGGSKKSPKIKTKGGTDCVARNSFPILIK